MWSNWGTIGSALILYVYETLKILAYRLVPVITAGLKSGLLVPITLLTLLKQEMLLEVVFKQCVIFPLLMVWVLLFPSSQQSLLWLQVLCLHLWHCWPTIFPCLQAICHLVPHQGRNPVSSSMSSPQRRGTWWKQTALMMRNPLPKVCWWRQRSESLLQRSI